MSWRFIMKHIKTIARKTIKTGANTGCGECQAS
ncbi:MAG: six-cysteine peptide SCIFF, partial [Lentisphaerae bacterium]|nr:six-cysteine peptide SCIFF [Lentisphaerota bacterium]